MSDQKPLNEIMEFDHVVTVHPDGSVTDGPKGLHVPELWEGELEGEINWELLTGFSNQSSHKGRYLGPIMHDSEFIGGGLEDYIRDNPGIYVAIISNYFVDEDPNGETEVSGWAVARYIGPPIKTPWTAELANLASFLHKCGY